jgi:hypothetical protein
MGGIVPRAAIRVGNTRRSKAPGRRAIPCAGTGQQSREMAARSTVRAKSDGIDGGSLRPVWVAPRNLAISLAITFGSGLVFYPALGLPWLTRRIIFPIAFASAACSPLIVPPEARLTRFIAMLCTVAVAARLYDTSRGADAGFFPGPWIYFCSLFHPFALVLRRVLREESPPRRSDLRQTLICAAAGMASVALIILVFCINWRRLPFVAEHSAKAVSVFLMVQFLPNALASAIRLVGIPATNFAGPFFLAQTPAEFWRLYNRPAGQFLHEYVFKPGGGRSHPLTATLLTFLISGVIHEYVFDIPAGRVLGWQMLFFILQGLAVLATVRLRPGGWLTVPASLLTLAFNLASAWLFLRCLNVVLPFYVNRSP